MDAPQSTDPFEQFRQLFARARESEPFDPTRAALATADADGRPSVRYVLVRGFEPPGFTFYTNYESPKARDLEDNPRAALAWHWATVDVQLRASGSVRRASAAVSDAYFAGRPRGSQIGAWASRQSARVESREILEAQVREVESRFEGHDVERPPFWGGYVLIPERFELWINRDSRLHDRFLYLADGKGGWKVERLQP